MNIGLSLFWNKHTTFRPCFRSDGILNEHTTYTCLPAGRNDYKSIFDVSCMCEFILRMRSIRSIKDVQVLDPSDALFGRIIRLNSAYTIYVHFVP